MYTVSTEEKREVGTRVLSTGLITKEDPFLSVKMYNQI